MSTPPDPLQVLVSAAALPEEWEVVLERLDNDVLRLSAREDQQPAEECACGGPWIKGGWSKDRWLRALPLGRYAVLVRLTRQVYRCGGCRRTASVPKPAFAGSLLSTLRDAVVTDALELPIQWVARRYELSRGVVARVTDKALAARLASTPRPSVRHLGIDGVHIDGDLRTALVDGETGRYLALYANERPGTVKLALRALAAPPELVSMDLSYATRSAVQAVYPAATRVADRYHVVQAVHTVFDRYRVAVVKGRSTKLLRPKGKASQGLAQALEKVGYGEVAEAWRWRNALDEVWAHEVPAAAKAQLLAWVEACPPGIQPLAQGTLATLVDWADEISNHALGSNARTEAAHRRARYWGIVAGPLNWERVAQRLILAPSGASLNACHEARLRVLAEVGARQQRKPKNSHSASAPPLPHINWTRAERRKRARAKSKVARGVVGGG